jgi:hypothetical protein
MIMAKVVEDVDLIMIPLTLMEKWMMEYRSWYEFNTHHRTRFEVFVSLTILPSGPATERLSFN